MKNLMISPGDIIKIKYKGMRKPFKVLGPLDTITPDTLHAGVLDYWPMCYSETLSQFNLNLDWKPTYCNGDLVCDDHTHRIYLQPVNFNNQN